MKNILIIFKKELKDTLRDKRTLFMMIFLPLLIIPIVMIGILKITQSQVEKSLSKTINIGFMEKVLAEDLFRSIENVDNINIFEYNNIDSIYFAINENLLDGAVVIEEDFADKIKNDQQGSVQLYYKGSDAFDLVYGRLSTVINELDSTIVTERIERLNLDKYLFDAISVQKIDLSSLKETIANLAGGYLPYLFIIFGFMGAIYPGIDLGAGEKERGSLETLLSTPAKRITIVIGKFLVVMTSSIVTASIGILSLILTVQFVPDIPAEYLSAISQMFDPKIIILLLTLILPLSIFFSAIILSLSIYAKSFKEAQSVITPLNIVIIFPAMFGLIPGIELNSKTASIPILNVALATKDVLAGTANHLLLAEVYLSLFIFASISLLFCVKWFQREETLFRA